MAKKEETISLIDTFSEFKELKNIDRTRIRVTSKYGVIVKLWRMRTLKTRTCRFL